jgi:hypothetical protein
MLKSMDHKKMKIVFSLGRLIVFLAVLALMCAGCHKSEVQQAGPITCPPEIETAQEPVDLPEGWVDRSGERMPEIWQSVTFFDGDPRQGGHEIEPKLSRVVHDEFQQTWSMRKQAGTQKTWLACRYYLSSVSLIRPLADDVTECSGKFNNVSYPEVDSLTCK